MSERWCVICQDALVYAVDRCRACYRFLRRNGRDRERRDIEKLMIRRYDIPYLRKVRAEEVKVLLTLGELRTCNPSSSTP